MDETALRDLVAKVKVGTLSRRAFVQKVVALGLTVPMAGQVLRHCGVAKAEATFQYKPTKRGELSPIFGDDLNSQAAFLGSAADFVASTKRTSGRAEISRGG